MDANQNRLFLDPLFGSRYPAGVLKHYSAVGDFAFIRGGDLEKISEPLDFLGVNYFCDKP